jgi:hypothetical protein
MGKKNNDFYQDIIIETKTNHKKKKIIGIRLT